jgi:deazaflavin-dependent oxidoreductase (nitroreductase family)
MTSLGSRTIARLLSTRWLMRIPIGLVRARLGWIFGGRIVMIEHRGRVSGERRFVVVEVVQRPEPTLIRVPSGFGGKAQWYRNLEANGVAFLSLGLRFRVPAEVRLLDETESRERLADYAREHPVAWPKLRDAMAHATGTDDPVIPIVEFRLQR